MGSETGEGPNDDNKKKPKSKGSELDSEDFNDLQADIDEMDANLPPVRPTPSRDRKVLRDASSSSFTRLLLICLVSSGIATYPNPIANIVIGVPVTLTVLFVYIFLIEFTTYPSATYLGVIWGKRGKVLESYLLFLGLGLSLAFGIDLLLVFEGG